MSRLALAIGVFTCGGVVLRVQIPQSAYRVCSVHILRSTCSLMTHPQPVYIFSSKSMVPKVLSGI